MNDVGFIIAGWGVVLGGLGLYAWLLERRLRDAREASLQIRREAERDTPPDRPA